MSNFFLYINPQAVARELFLGEPSGIRARFLFRRPHLFLFMA